MKAKCDMGFFLKYLANFLLPRVLDICIIGVALIFTTPLHAEKNNPHLSLKLEVKRSIKLGNNYLLGQGNENGSWSDDKHPAITALVLTAFQRDPNSRPGDTQGAIDKGLNWLLSLQKPDGGIYTEGLANYNTATSIMALLASGHEDYAPAILRARSFLVGQQTDWGKGNEDDNPYDGGVGYGGTYKHSDMSNTHLALEAIYHTRQLALDNGAEGQSTLDWESALTFISRCQNLTETNDQEWATDDPEEKGGFVYFPSSSKAGEKPLKDGKTALRSYGSMTYAGLLSLIYVELDADDPRVTAALAWLAENFSVEDNPGLEKQGLFYYYQVMAKSLAASGRHTLTTAEGKEIDWRMELGKKLVSTQGADGSWKNETSRWWENDPILTTAYAVLALEQLYATM